MEPERVTRNLDALLLENQALRQEVAALREELRRLRARGRLDGVSGAGPRVTTGMAPGVTGMAPGITGDQVRVWMELLAQQPGWSRLRVDALKALLDAQRGADAGRGTEAGRGLEDGLDRLSPGLGTDLRRALRGHTGKGKHVVRAAFARYGVRAPEWLSADPRRVIDDLLADLADLEARRARTQQSRERQSRERQSHQSRPAWGSDPRAEALRILGLSPGATLREVKAAHRRLVKCHHPDAGGEVDDFRRIDAAYRQLIS
jgi:hypothetical protein